MATALATQVFLSTAEEARSSELSLAPAPGEEGCAKAMWPNIPERCLQRVEPKVVTLVLSQNNYWRMALSDMQLACAAGCAAAGPPTLR
ncbi:hypothetical protein [Mesorhizobium sp. L103C565B0]|uniref:hypothetical protein n=1 Tax=Mesorhizobium sp. L103C565B0 TaxID=1287094 RepID=UPI0012DD1153|nr:hypothetical protein [Mesorhizobium sp. L103C565B0]